MMMFVPPMYCNNVEIRTFGNKKEGDVVVLRFYYAEPDRDKPQPPLIVAAVIMPRTVAKDVLRKFLTFMSAQDEGIPTDGKTKL